MSAQMVFKLIILALIALGLVAHIVAKQLEQRALKKDQEHDKGAREKMEVHANLWGNIGSVLFILAALVALAFAKDQ